MRMSKVSRKTLETEVFVEVNLDGEGKTKINTGIAFLDHMLTSLATHSLIDLTIEVKGDLKHHIIEDVSICLGNALRKALDDEKRIERFGSAIVPMDCSLAFCAIDLAKRPYVRIELKLKGRKIEDMACEDANHFLNTLASSLQANIHAGVKYGSNNHHKLEAIFKALALSLKKAITIDPRRKRVPSSKGVI